ncbi:MAG: hypothetical protein ABI860_04290 [Gemmatimonadales bacterium]
MSAGPVLAAVGLGVLACAERPAVRAAVEGDGPAVPALADSLVGTAAGGEEIWFTLSRADSGATGRCTDRAIEIRHGARRIPVPLLYTASVPTILNDTTLRARLSTHCAPGDSYLVDLRSGRPVRER